VINPALVSDQPFWGRPAFPESVLPIILPNTLVMT